MQYVARRISLTAKTDEDHAMAAWSFAHQDHNFVRMQLLARMTEEATYYAKANWTDKNDLREWIRAIASVLSGASRVEIRNVAYTFGSAPSSAAPTTPLTMGD